MEPRISIITLGVADLARSVEFYRDGLGLTLYDENTESIAFFQNRGTWLALYPRSALAADVGIALDAVIGDSGFSGVTLAHNLRSKEEVDDLLAVAVTAGATLVKPAQDTFWGGYSGYFSDPDGYLWEIAWNPHFWIE
jgi:catechol 2,3-dioxygenase-like lactoylglutathione lyase family enzyme